MNFDSTEYHRRHTPEPELVPILDALTCIIFFLMYTTSFMELTSLIVPPASTNIVTKAEAANELPLTPRLYVEMDHKEIKLNLVWTGKNPGTSSKKINRDKPERYSRDLEKVAAELVKGFMSTYPNEKSIQLGLSERATYQELVTIMDGVRLSIKDIVLMSPEDVISYKGESNGS